MGFLSRSLSVVEQGIEAAVAVQEGLGGSAQRDGPTISRAPIKDGHFGGLLVAVTLRPVGQNEQVNFDAPSAAIRFALLL